MRYCGVTMDISEMSDKQIKNELRWLMNKYSVVGDKEKQEILTDIIKIYGKYNRKSDEHDIHER